MQMEEFKLKTSAFLYPVVDHKIALIRTAEYQEQREQKVAERKIHQQKVETDLVRIDEVRTQNLPLITQRDFRKAASSLNRLVTEMKTPEGQQALIIHRELYDRMDLLKKFLMTRITASPYRGGTSSELGGDAVGADINGIKVGLGQHGMMVIPWDQVSARSFLQLANFYLADTAIPEKDRADAALSTAVFCYESGIFKYATQFSEQAVKLDPELKVKARKLMPDILAD
jgi:hypothetical protein